MKDVVKAPKSPEQEWVLWNVRANEYLTGLNNLYRPFPVRMLAPEFVSWFLEVYFDIMADLESIGVPQFECEVRVSPFSPPIHPLEIPLLPMFSPLR
jgi:hypothetical protein